ncbi:MAG: hypothetical protein K6E32_11325 [Lachnospiraceae bacterium]|nr:hypothetical protein [Lachnospiraceae bacterium]
MANEKIVRIKRSAEVTATVLKVIRVILIVAGCIAFAGGLVAFTQAAKPELWDMLRQYNIYPPYETGEFRGHGFSFIEAFDIKDPFIFAGANCMAAAAVCAIASVCVHFIRKTFVIVKDSETPFTKDSLKSIRISAILVTILVAISSIGQAAIVGLVFWCLYSIFDYGIELQRDADETL